MKVVWKYPIEIEDAFTVELPAGAKILTAQTQGTVPTFWALVNPDAPKVERAFRFFGTGHQHPDERFGCYVGTCQIFGGSLVFHLFDMGEVIR